jgi:hypothetical protein
MCAEMARDVKAADAALVELQQLRWRPFFARHSRPRI